jgi:hypothetical protein
VAQIKYIGPCWNIKEVFRFVAPPKALIVGILGSFCDECVFLLTQKSLTRGKAEKPQRH